MLTRALGLSACVGLSCALCTVDAVAQKGPLQSRLIDVVFIQAEGGLSYVDLTALSSQGRVVPTLTSFRGLGGGGGASLGFRLWYFALAVGLHSAHFDGQGLDGGSTAHSAFDLGQVLLDAHLRIPIGILELWARVGLGYAWLGNFQFNERYAESTSTVEGYTGRAGAGLDLWLGDFFTLGLGANLSLSNLRRGGVTRSDTVCPVTDPICVELRQDGDAAGLLVDVQLQGALHF